jgi:hypothetical protein
MTKVQTLHRFRRVLGSSARRFRGSAGVTLDCAPISLVEFP